MNAQVSKLILGPVSTTNFYWIACVSCKHEFFHLSDFYSWICQRSRYVTDTVDQQMLSFRNYGLYLRSKTVLKSKLFAENLTEPWDFG